MATKTPTAETKMDAMLGVLLKLSERMDALEAARNIPLPGVVPAGVLGPNGTGAEAPYGLKADGTPRSKPGRKPAATVAAATVPTLTTAPNANGHRKVSTVNETIGEVLALVKDHKSKAADSPFGGKLRADLYRVCSKAWTDNGAAQSDRLGEFLGTKLGEKSGLSQTDHVRKAIDRLRADIG